jgi:hypothetical protein
MPRGRYIWIHADEMHDMKDIDNNELETKEEKAVTEIIRRYYAAPEEEMAVVVARHRSTVSADLTRELYEALKEVNETLRKQFSGPLSANQASLLEPVSRILHERQALLARYEREVGDA